MPTAVNDVYTLAVMQKNFLRRRFKNPNIIKAVSKLIFSSSRGDY